MLNKIIKPREVTWLLHHSSGKTRFEVHDSVIGIIGWDNHSGKIVTEAQIPPSTNISLHVTAEKHHKAHSDIRVGLRPFGKEHIEWGHWTGREYSQVSTADVGIGFAR